MFVHLFNPRKAGWSDQAQGAGGIAVGGGTVQILKVVEQKRGEETQRFQKVRTSSVKGWVCHHPSHPIFMVPMLCAASKSSTSANYDLSYWHQMNNERKKLDTSSKDQLNRYLPRLEAKHQITNDILGRCVPSQNKEVQLYLKVAPNKKVTEKTFLVGGLELISICVCNEQLKNRLKWISQHHSQPRQVSLFSSCLYY